MDKKSFLIQGSILTGISLLMRSSNMYYRSYLSTQIGAEGMGLYQLIFSVFVLAITLSTSGISLAVTRLVSTAIANGKRDTIRSTVNKCLLFCFSLSLSISMIFFFFSDFSASFFLGNPQASKCLKILGVGLPFMSLCTCLKGYFLAVDEGVSSGIADLCEQITTIGLTVIIFTLLPFKSLEDACASAVFASTVGEIFSFVIDITACRISLKKNTPRKKSKATKVFSAMAHIALPCTFSSAARSLLSTAENLLIPKQLRLFGASYSQSMVQYGLLQGMAIPILYFPSAFIGSFASLLIPKICKEYELKHQKAVAYISAKSLNTAIHFGVITSVFFIFYSKEISLVFYQNLEPSFFIKIFAPLVPLMYLDIVVDCLLKALDQQLNSMKYNIYDSALRVIFILIFMRIFGINSYIAILFFSTIFNAYLSLNKLIEVTKLKLHFLRNIFFQIPTALICLYFSSIFPYKFENELMNLILLVIISYGLYYFISFVLNVFKTSK